MSMTRMGYWELGRVEGGERYQKRMRIRAVLELVAMAAAVTFLVGLGGYLCGLGDYVSCYWGEGGIDG